MSDATRGLLGWTEVLSGRANMMGVRSYTVASEFTSTLCLSSTKGYDADADVDADAAGGSIYVELDKRYMFHREHLPTIRWDR